MKSVTPTEYQECRAFWDLAQYHPILRDYLIHIANEGKRSLYFGKQLKSIGLRKGIPDYVLAYPSGSYHSLWFDVKRKGTFGHRVDQDRWIERLKLAGNYAAYAYGADEAYQLCLDYLAGKL